LASGLASPGYQTPKDPVAIWLSLGIAAVIIGALLSAICAFLFGVIELHPAPRTIAEADLALARKSVTKSESKDAQAFADLVMAQADTGSLGEAEATLRSAQALNLDETRTQALSYAHAYLLVLSDKPDQALTVYLQVMEALDKAYQDELAREGEMNWAAAEGRPRNYSLAALAVSELYRAQGKRAEEIEYLSRYLEENPTDAQALTLRGQARLALGDAGKVKDVKDAAAAVKDFKKALSYLPDDPQASQGLRDAQAQSGGADK
jgi:tetratricopeptide (TPR) repeat protein